MEIELNNQDGITLKTKDKYCSEDIDITPKLQTKTTTVNGKVTTDENYVGLKEVTVNVQTAPTLQSKTVTPTKSQQNIAADSGYDGLSGVTVNAIPDNYVIPTGTVNITANGTHNVSGKASVNVNVSAQLKLQQKTVTPTKSKQTVKSDSSYDGLSEVIVNAIPDEYISPSGSLNITENGTYDIKAKANVVVNVESEKPTLNAPTISLRFSTLTITNPATNGNFVTSYRIFNGSAELAVVTSKTVDLSTLLTDSGTYSITVKASAPNFNNSAASNSMSYKVVAAVTGYTLTVTVEYGDETVDITYADGSTATVGAGTYDNVASVAVDNNMIYTITDASGNTHISPYTLTSDTTVYASFCIIEGTQITLADGTTKAIEDITYDNELLVWNFYAGRFDTAKPSWIKVEETAPRYNLVKFSNGSEVGFVGAGGEKGYHRIFNKEAGAFTYTGNFKETPNGTTTFAQDGTFPTVVSQAVVEKEVKFYNVITDKHYNIFANGILTSCRLSNKYRIEDMKYVGEKLISDEQEKAYFERIENKRK